MNAPTEINSSISRAVKDSNKIPLVKNIFSNGRIETAATVEKTVSKEILLMSGRTMIF